MLTTLGQDIAYASRSLRRSPGFTAVAVVCIAAGVGVTTTMFSAVNGLLLHPLPFPGTGTLVAVHSRNLERNLEHAPISWADYASWRDGSHTFGVLAAWGSGFPTLSGEGDVERVEGAQVSAGLFPALGVTPLLGGTFDPSEEQIGNERSVVLGYGLWQRRYGGDRTLVGRQIRVNGAPHTVVGVMPEGFDFPERSQVWLPLAADPVRERHGARTRLAAIGRLKPGASLREAKEDLAAIARGLESTFPKENGGWQAEVVPLRDDLVGPLRRPMIVFLGAAVLVLLIACTNVANLLLARGARRRAEIAVRLAIGAGRGRIMTQVLAESVLLSLAGGAIGAGAASFGIRLLSLAFPDGVPSYLHISIDGTVLGFAVLLSLATGMLFGIVPALRAAGATLGSALGTGGRGSTGGFMGSRLRSGLVSAEVALSLVLVISAALLIRTDRTLEDEIGFDTRGVVSFRIPIPLQRYDGDRRRAFYDDLFARIRALPGVEGVGSAQGLPFGALGGSYQRAQVAIEGEPTPPTDEPGPLKQEVSSGYFQAIGVPVVRGRDFTPAGGAPLAAEAVVNQMFVRRYLRGLDPIGRRIGFGGTSGTPMSWLTIVGVAKNVRQDRPPAPIEPAVFVPFAGASQTLVVRTRLADPLSVVPSIRAIVQQLDPELPTYLIQTLDRVVATALWRQRLQSRVLGLFATLALLLAVFGIYGVISYAVVQRTRELGVRLALGATRAQVMALVLGQGVRLALIGIVVGGAAAFAFTRLLGGLLYGVGATDPPTFIGASVLLGGVAVIAGVLPALRAANVDPIVALRWE